MGTVADVASESLPAPVPPQEPVAAPTPEPVPEPVAVPGPAPEPAAPTPPSTPAPAPAPPPPTPPAPPAAVATARYAVTFDSTWSPATHPTDFPASAHYSPLIGGTHAASATFWREGALASEGIRRMAERGGVSPLDSEVAAAIAAGTAERVISGPALGRSPGSAAMEFEISQAFPLVTLVTMVAPSPDWFTGVSGLPLYENGQWRDEVRVDVFGFDAGTDSGVSYSSPDQESVPRQPIARLAYPLSASGPAPRLGSFTFRRLQ